MRLSPVRSLLVACGLLVLTNGVVFYVANHVLDADRSWEEPFTRAAFGAVALVSVATVALDRHRLAGARLGRPDRIPMVAIGFFAAWLVASSLWSLNPEITRGRSLIYVGLAAFAWIVADLDFPGFRRAVTIAVGIAVGVSLVAVAVSDSIGVDRNDDWRGVFTSRNSLAPVAGVAILMGVSNALDSRGRRRLGAGALAVLAAVAMLGSGSRTAWLALVVAAGLAGFVVATRTSSERHRPLVRRVAAGLGAIGVAAGVLIGPRLWADSTFEQRRTIWDHVWDRIGDRPLQGYGWFNVWGDADFVAADPLLARGSAHNSFLEVWLGLGLVGLVAFVLIIALALRGTFLAAWRRPSVETATWLALVVFLVIENLTESFVLWFSYNWVLLMAAALRSGVDLGPGAGPRSGVGRRTPEPTEPANA